MTREQAEAIQRHLLDAVSAISRAEAAIIKAGDYKAMADNLYNIANNLNWGLLPAIYKQFPDLEPPGEVPTINSELQWQEVSLPPSVTEHDLDEMIFSLLKPRWQKMAMILVDAQKYCEKEAWPIKLDVVAARIQALADEDRIDHQGDLRYWRFSEVRLRSQLRSVT
ncbi:MAG TPA: hypothetical protein VFR21_03800 [Bradyrhizobium sp.]|jgi:hypothetical protein|nr:hypothetical protein [Bradyrhizobium sp.]